MKNKGAELSWKARQNAYSPYSGVKVGAAVKTENGQFFVGANIENASFSATLCAERVAIFSAIAQGAKKITDIFIATDFKDPWPPCGMCRQVICEFATPRCKIHLVNKKGLVRSLSFHELFPQGFEPTRLKHKK